MPRNRVLRDYRKHRRFNFQIVQELSNKYGLSLLATMFRLFHLDVHPMMIVHYKQGVIRSIFNSADFYHYPKHQRNQVPEDTVMHEFISKGVKQHKTQQLWTGDWFQCSREEKLYEHCLYYDQYGACYSLLWKE